MSTEASALLSVEEALARLLRLADQDPLLDWQELPLAELDGRVLARPVLANADLPAWPNSAMDGYALRLADWQGEALAVSQSIFAGYLGHPLQAGTCARIFTGAPLPVGADCVEMQENVELLADGRVFFRQPLQAQQNIRPQGQEARKGECLLEAGSRLGPLEIGLAASLGYARLPVQRRLRVALLATGDELVEPGNPLVEGQIYNSNSYLLQVWLRRLGCELLKTVVLADDLQSTRQVLAGFSQADLILSTGGVSVGEADFLGQVLREAGELALWKLAIKPGKPLTVGRYQGVPVIGLPGNPASTLVTFALLARPYLLRRLGVKKLEPLRVQLPAGFAWSKAGKRREYLRARIEQGSVVVHANQSSAVLRSAVWAEGLVEIPEGRQIQPGELLSFIPFSALLG